MNFFFGSLWLKKNFCLLFLLFQHNWATFCFYFRAKDVFVWDLTEHVFTYTFFSQKWNQNVNNYILYFVYISYNNKHQSNSEPKFLILRPFQKDLSSPCVVCSKVYWRENSVTKLKYRLTGTVQIPVCCFRQWLTLSAPNTTSDVLLILLNDVHSFLLNSLGELSFS